jgi:threonine/homoserine/homoserine lactone efflux protein
VRYRRWPGRTTWIERIIAAILVILLVYVVWRS